jgi:hypothetical protein
MPSLAGHLVGRVRLEMLGRGFAPVATPPFFDDGPLLELRRTVLPAHGNRWWKFPGLVRYSRWLERLLGQALPEESLGLSDLELRLEPAGYEDEQVDRLHADGSYLRSVCTLYGPTTIYRDGAAELPVPSGQTLLMTAMDRARAIGVRCTLHRRPGAGQERAVIVGSFEPRGNDRDVVDPRPAQGRFHRARGSFRRKGSGWRCHDWTQRRSQTLASSRRS